MTKPFAGSGGGGGSSKVTNVKDNLVADSQIELLLGLCQGPIKGLANGFKSFHIGDTQYQNNNGDFNFQSLDVEIFQGHTPGDVIQPVLGGFEDYRALPTPLKLRQGETQNFTTIHPTSRAIIVRICVHGLQRQGTDAQLTPIVGVNNSFNSFLPNTMELIVEWSKAGQGTWVNPFNGVYPIIGKTVTDEYHEVRIPVDGNGPYDIRVTNLTADLHNPDARCEADIAGHYDVTAGLYGTARATNIGQILFEKTPYIRTTDFPNQRPDGSYGIDQICVGLTIDSLYHNLANGSVLNATIQFLVEYKQSSHPDWLVCFNGPVSITGKTTVPYPADYRFNVAPVEDTYDIRVTRLTPNTPDYSYQMSWQSLSEIVGGPVAYDGVAVAYVLGTATNQFTTIPDFWGVYDLKMVKIPSNYDPYARTYTGAWDGTFKQDWTSNPAWCLYDLAMSEVYGLRKFWPVFNMDKWDVYGAGQWCDQLVPDGQGGRQPRYTYNGVISDARGALEQLQFMAGVFNGGFIDDGDGVTRLVYDHDEPACAVFTPENVLVDSISYGYTDISSRHNSVSVKFNNINLNYQIDSRTQQDPDHIARFGENPLEVAGLGCVEPHEAVRRAAYKMLIATTEKEIISFKTNRQGLMVRPYNVILVSDPTMGNGLTGRIRSLDARRQSVLLRDLLYLELGVDYIFSTHATNPAYPATSDQPFVLVEIPFHAPLQGETYAFELSSPLPVGVYDNAQFSVGSIGNLAGVPKAYRVTKVEESDGDPDNIAIEGIEINRQKWILADNAAGTVSISYLNFPAELGPPTGLSVSTTQVNINGAIIANVTAVWVRPLDARVNGYELQYKSSVEAVWLEQNTVSRERFDLFNVPDGIYDFRIRSIASHGLKSQWVYSFKVAAGLNLPPDDVSLLTMNLVGDNINLSWTPVKALNLSYYWIKFSPLIGDGASWDGAVDLLPNVKATHAGVAGQAGTYFVKAVNTSGLESTNAAFASTATQSLSHIIIEKIAEHPDWTGTKTHFYIENSLLKLRREEADVGLYEWRSPDLGESLTCRLSMAIVLGGEKDGYFMSTWDKLSNVPTLSGTTPSDYRAKLFIHSTDDMVNWTDYTQFATGDYKGRAFGYKLELSAININVRPHIRHLTTIMQVPARSEVGKSLFVPDYGATIIIKPPFKTLPAFAITSKDAETGDYWKITNESIFGFTVQYFNQNGRGVGRYIDWQAFGFGGH